MPGSVLWLSSYTLHAIDPACWDGNTDCAVPAHMDWQVGGAMRLGGEQHRLRSAGGGMPWG